MSDENSSLSPNQRLAKLISEELVREGLILGEKEAEVYQKLAAGSAKAEDWLVWIEDTISDVSEEAVQ